jgi:hypothetical protein
MQECKNAGTGMQECKNAGLQSGVSFHYCIAALLHWRISAYEASTGLSSTSRTFWASAPGVNGF